MDFLQCAVVVPQAEVLVHRAARWQVLWDVPPLAAGARDVHYAVDRLAHVDAPHAAAALGRWDQRLDMRLLRIRQVARIAQLVAIVAGAVFDRPHTAPQQAVPRRESQRFEPVQAVITANGNRL